MIRTLKMQRKGKHATPLIFSHTKITLLVNKNGILSILGVKFIAVDCQSICERELFFLILRRKKLLCAFWLGLEQTYTHLAIYVPLDERSLGLS